jgi:hypothetical protein
LKWLSSWGRGEKLRELGELGVYKEKKRKHYLIKKKYIIKINKIMQNWVPKNIMVGRVGS